jgi:hypothetical protein
LFELGIRQLGHPAIAARRAIHAGVMDHDHLPIRAQLGIQLHAIRALLQRQLKCRKGIFRGMPG